MSNFVEGSPAPHTDPLDALRDYSIDLKDRLNRADRTLGDGLGLLNSGLAVINTSLIQAERPDLAIADPATMMPIDYPRDVIDKGGNFTPKFVFSTGVRETDKLDWRGRAVQEHISVTEEELLALHKLPKLKDSDELAALQKTGQYPAINGNNHASKPAFLRMLALFPEFTKDLVLGMSEPANKYRALRFEPELFVGYQLMSRLVGTSDRDVIDSTNIDVDDQYLCR